MIRRAKISVFFTLVGALTASGALPNREQRHTAFQPGLTTSLAKPVVLKPAQAAIANRRWQGTKVQRITAGMPATVAPGTVWKAGGAR